MQLKNVMIRWSADPWSVTLKVIKMKTWEREVELCLLLSFMSYTSLAHDYTQTKDPTVWLDGHKTASTFIQGILKGEVSLYHWPPVWLVWTSLFCKKIVSTYTADSKRVKQEVNGTVILPPLVFPAFPALSHPPSKWDSTHAARHAVSWHWRVCKVSIDAITDIYSLL